jgi:hypothetical protein
MAEDRRIDEALRNVPLPPGLADRVVPAALFEDAALDGLLGRVALPDGLAERVRAAVFSPAPGRGVDLDRAAGILPSAAVPPATPQQRRLLGRWAVAIARPAAAVAVSLAALGGLVLTGLEFSRRMEPAAPRPALVLAPGPAAASVAPGETAIGMAAPETSPSLEPADPLATGPVPVASDAADLAVTMPDPFAPPAPMVRGAAVGAAADPPLAGTGMRIVPPPGTEPRRSVPRVAGFDLAFEMSHGESPFIDPRAAVALQFDRPPLTMRTDAFESLVALAGRKPRSASIASLRTEELVAAIPAPARSAAVVPQVEMHAVRSLRGRPDSCLVEVCVTAPPLARNGDAPLDAVLALDRSTGSEPLLWPRVCRAVDAVADQMRAADRISVVVGGRQPRLAGSRLDAAGLRRLAAALAAEPIADATDFDATIRVAALEAGHAPARPLIVVANAESVDRARGDGLAAVSAWREALAATGPDAGRQAAVRFVLVDPSEPTVREPLEPGFGRTPADAVAIRRAVLEQVFAASTLTARQCRLEVAFDPRAVAAYRLVGHRQSAMESLARGEPPAVDLHAGEVARVVYELVPLAMQDAAVKAMLTCRPMGVDGERTITASLPLLAIESGPLPSPHGCELLLAVAVSELATASPHAGPRGAAAQAAADLAAAWRARGDVTPYGTAILDAADRIGILKAAKPASAPRR